MFSGIVSVVSNEDVLFFRVKWMVFFVVVRVSFVFGMFVRMLLKLIGISSSGLKFLWIVRNSRSRLMVIIII